MLVKARFKLASGQEVDLGPGDVIGRLRTAALRLSDPRISEAHALVSLRGAVLKLLGLRGRFSVEGKPRTEVGLEPGMRIVLAGCIPLDVLAVELPSRVLAITGDGLPPQVLDSVVSIRATPRLEVLPRFVADADALTWRDPDGYVLRVAGAPDRPLVEGSAFTVGAHTLRAIAMDMDALGRSDTRGQGQVELPLRLICRYDTVHIHQSGDITVHLDGLLARLVCELAAIERPVAWEVLARELWPSESDALSLRQKWDATLARLRKKLRDGRVRADLVRANRLGLVELFLGPADRIEDET